MASPIVLAFDLYGTLLSTASIANTLNRYLDEKHATEVAATWRTLQLEYTWRLNSMQLYESFSTVTERALRHALIAHGYELPSDGLEAVMEAYDTLSTFPDVEPALVKLRADSRFRCVVFSNGSPSMLKKSIYHSPDMSSHASNFHDVISVDDVRRFKPDPAVYRHLAKRVGMRGHESHVWLISGNPFDVVGARAVGLQAVWVNRQDGRKWEDQLENDDIGKPSVIVKSLEEVIGKIMEWSSARE